MVGCHVTESYSKLFVPVDILFKVSQTIHSALFNVTIRVPPLNLYMVFNTETKTDLLFAIFPPFWKSVLSHDRSFLDQVVFSMSAASIRSSIMLPENRSSAAQEIDNGIVLQLVRYLVPSVTTIRFSFYIKTFLDGTVVA